MKKSFSSTSSKSFVAPTHVQTFSILLVFIWTQHTVLPFVAQVFRRLPIIGQIYDWLITLLIIAAIILAFPRLNRGFRGIDILFYIACSLLVVITMLVYPDNAIFIRSHWWTILGTAVPMYFVGLCYSHTNYKMVLFWSSLISVITMYGYQLHLLASGRTLSSDNMHAAYNILPSIVYLIYWAFEKRNVLHWVIAAFAFSLTFIFGTRGAMLAAVVFFFAALILHTFRSNSTLTKIATILVSVISIAILSSSDTVIDIALWLAEKSRSAGFSTRIFDFIINGELMESAGRERIYDVTLEAINANPLWGYGLFGDRVVAQATGSNYAHNFFLEVWCQYGLIFGTIILLTIVALCFRALKISWKQDIFYFILMLICMIFTKLMFSGSYAVEPYFFFTLGLCVHTIRQYKELQLLHYETIYQTNSAASET